MTTRQQVLVQICLCLGLYLFTVHLIPSLLVPEWLGRQIWFWSRIQFILLIGTFGAAMMALVPERKKYSCQTIVLISLFLVARFNSQYLISSLIMISLPIFWGIMLKVIPYNKPGVYKSAIIVAVVSVPLLIFVTTTKLGFIPTFCAFMVNVMTSYILAVVHVRNSGSPLSIPDTMRLLCSSFWLFGPFSVSDILKTDSQFSTFLRGFAWVAVSIVLIFTVGDLSIIKFPIFQPLHTFVSGNILASLLVGFATWLISFVNFFSEAFMVYGICHMLGIPVGKQIGEIWKASNFIEYWKKANTYRYHFMNTFFNEVLKQKSEFINLLSIVLIFLISGTFHLHRGESQNLMLRWFIDGLVTAITFWWLKRQSQKRIRLYLEGKNITTKQKHVAWDRFVFVVKVFLVLSAHGFLYQLSYGVVPQ